MIEAIIGITALVIIAVAIAIGELVAETDTQEPLEIDPQSDIPFHKRDGFVETLDESQTVWKACRHTIVKLELPKGTTVVHPSGCSTKRHDKRRASKAIVKQLYRVPDIPLSALNEANLLMLEKCKKDYSIHNEHFKYERGEEVRPDRELSVQTYVDCASGIHFFTSVESALAWYNRYNDTR